MTKGVISAVQFLRNGRIRNTRKLEGKEVAVIGGGNVSMDAVLYICKIGAKKSASYIEEELPI